MTFERLGLVPELIEGLKAEGLTRPTPIQEKAIPVLLQGKDAYVSSATGTGKTLAYLIPLFEMEAPAVISTATKVLQHQLKEKDIPRNYLNLHHENLRLFVFLEYCQSVSEFFLFLF